MGEERDDAGVPSRFPWPPVILLGCLAATFLLDAVLPLPFPGGTVGLVLSAAGAVLALGAVAVDVWAIRTLSRARTTVLPHKASGILVTGGPFARSRNPIYLANAALVAGLGLFAGTLWGVPAAVLLALLTARLAIRGEERHLAARFGEAYEAYRARVPRWL